MNLRDELRPKFLSEQDRQQMIGLVELISEKVFLSQECDSEIIRFNSITGASYGKDDFRDILEAQSFEDFVDDAAVGRPLRISDISDEELEEIIRRITVGEASSSEVHFWLGLLKVNLGYGEIGNLIFWPERTMSPSEILAEARRLSRIY